MKIMTFLAHPDDEVNCAGLLIKNRKEGGENLIVCFTSNELRSKELKESCRVIGSKLIDLKCEELNIIYGVKQRKYFVDLIRKFKPDIAVIQSQDYHPDHKRVHEIALDAIEFASHGGEKGWLIAKVLELEATALLPYPDIVCDISKEFSTKTRAFKKHESQVLKKHSSKYSLAEKKKRAELRGLLIRAKYGEAYKIHTNSIKGDFYPKTRGFKKVRELFVK